MEGLPHGLLPIDGGLLASWSDPQTEARHLSIVDGATLDERARIALANGSGIAVGSGFVVAESFDPAGLDIWSTETGGKLHFLPEFRHAHVSGTLVAAYGRRSIEVRDIASGAVVWPRAARTVSAAFGPPTGETPEPSRVGYRDAAPVAEPAQSREETPDELPAPGPVRTFDERNRRNGVMVVTLVAVLVLASLAFVLLTD